MPNPENLRPPIKPGEVRNPKGNNQYTYRRNFEKWFDEECAKRGRKGIARLFDQFEEGESRAQQLVMERAHPAVSKHEIEATGIESDALTAALNRFRSNGKGPVPVKPNGGSAA
jgi:hypothetical protein